LRDTPEFGTALGMGSNMDVPRPEFLRKKRTRRVTLAAIGAVAIASVAFAITRFEPASASADRAALLIDNVRRGEFVRQVRGPGVLVPREIRWVTAQAAGIVERLALKPGAAVEPESVIAELSNPELKRLVQEAEWARAQGEAELAALRLQLQGQVLDQKAKVAEAHADYEGTRLQALAEAEAAAQQAVSQLQVRRTQILTEQYNVRVKVEEERLRNLVNATAAQLRAQNARLEQLTNTLESQKQQLASLQVRAGMQGVLQALPVQIGQQLPAGAPVARVARPDDLVAELKIPELQAKDLVAGLNAKIDTRAGIVAGRVTRVDPAVAEGTVRVDVDLTGRLPAGARPDLSVEGVIEIERTPGSVFVARPAFGEPESEVSVFKLDAGGSHARRVPVKFGKESVNEIQVVSGLEPGDQIIVSDISQWSHYDELHIR
jgi:HlyD family secretion protein